MTPKGEKNQGWLKVKQMMGNRRVSFGSHVSHWFHQSPRHPLYSMSYYKFASKLIGRQKKVLDIGCGEGLGTWLLAVECGGALGVDLDDEAIKKAQGNWNDPRITFLCDDFFNLKQQKWDAILCLDVIEHILPENTTRFLQKTSDCLTHDGIAIIGTPNDTAQQYASEVAKAGHVNLFSHDRLKNEMARFFTHVFMFGANDEVVHTGFLPMSHYLIALGCKKRG